MNRKALDAFAEYHSLAEPGVEALLDLAGARPSRSEQLRFGIRMLQLAGVLSLAAGVVFFVAANWDALRIVGRFALLELLFVGCVGLALTRPPPAALGRYALLGAFIVAGALLALVGQTYQTGANVYELFLAWALLGLPLVIAGRWSVTWGAWLVVLNTALSLYCGWRPEGGPLGIVFSLFNPPVGLLLMAQAALNLAAWGICEATSSTRFQPAFSALAPQWLRRFMVACAVGSGTAAGAVALADNVDSADTVALLLLAALLIVITLHTLRRRLDVFPLAMVAASIIVIGAIAMGRRRDGSGTVLLFLITAWLIISSTASGSVLLKLVREWRNDVVQA